MHETNEVDNDEQTFKLINADEQEDANNKEDNVTLCQIMRSKRVILMTTYGLIMMVGSNMQNIIIPVIGADFFGGNNDDNNCSSSDGNAKYSYYNGIFSSIGGLLGFCTQAVIGRISDAYGRKPALCFTLLCLSSNVYMLCITENMWVYLPLLSITNIAGAFNGMPTVFQTSFADVVPPRYRSKVFTLLFGIAAAFLIITPIITNVIKDMYGNKGVFYVSSLLLFLSLLHLIFLYPETLDVSKRKPMNLKSYNPFRPLLDLKHNDVIFYICMIGLCCSLPEAGIDDILLSYVDDLLNLCDNDDKAIRFNAIFQVVFGTTILISQLIILPLISNKLSDVSLIFIGIVNMLVFMAVGVLLYPFPNIFLGYAFSICFGLSFLLPPLTAGLLSRYVSYKEQGVGLGTLHAVKGITYAVGPYMFGGLFDLFNNNGILKTAPFWIGAVFIACSFPIILYLLPNAIKRYQIQQQNLLLSSSNANDKTDKIYIDTNSLQYQSPSQSPSQSKMLSINQKNSSEITLSLRKAT